MTEKRNPNPFIRIALETKAAKEQKFELSGIHNKSEHIGKVAKMTSTPRATKVQRKAGRGR